MKQFLGSESHAYVRFNGSRRPVEILAIAQDTVGVTYPYEPFPEAGVTIDLEFDNTRLRACYHEQVVVAPVDKGDGMILRRAPSQTYMERRRTWRVPLAAKTTLRRPNDLVAHDAVVVDLSTEGLLVESNAPFQVGDFVELALPLNGRSLEGVVGRIVRVTSTAPSNPHAHGFGIWFLGLAPQTRKVLTLYMWRRLRELCPGELRALFPGSGGGRKAKQKPPAGPDKRPGKDDGRNHSLNALSRDIEGLR